MKSFGINVWPAKDLEDVMVFELEVETPFWQLTQRVHWSDLPAVIEDAVAAVMRDTGFEMR